MRSPVCPTGCCSRSGSIVLSLRSSSNVSVLFCDLDNFKPVNDEFGHGAGDVLLKLVADRLLGCVRPGDTVARLGGDEFAILLVDCPDAREVADRVVASMDTETVVLGRPVRTSISVGVAHHAGTRGADRRRQAQVRHAPVAEEHACRLRRPRSDSRPSKRSRNEKR